MRSNIALDALPGESAAPPGSEFCTAQDMERRFAEFPSALENTLEISERCQLILPLGERHYPKITLPQGETALERLQKLAEAGANKRYGKITPDITQRLEKELQVIGERDYAPLFLIVQEIFGTGFLSGYRCFVQVHDPQRAYL